jgi:hypothetical protein
MGLLIIRHKVKDFAPWKKAFDAHTGKQKAAGLTNPRVFRSIDDRSETVILFDMQDVAKAKEFRSSADLKSTMQSAGVLDQPTVFFLEDAH